MNRAIINIEQKTLDTIHNNSLELLRSTGIKFPCDKALGILKKHGWDEHFFQKASVILLGYGSIRFGEKSVESNSEIEQTLKEIDSNPDIPASMKQQLKQQITAARGAMGQTGQSLKQNIHPADLALVKAHIKELKPILDEDEE